LSDIERSVTPTGDGEGKRRRTFVCRDPLWLELEKLAAELECSVDYLVNDAIKNYVRQRARMSLAPVTPRMPPAPPHPPPPRAPWPLPVHGRSLPPPLPARLPPPPPWPQPPAPPMRLTVTYGAVVVAVDRSGFVIGRSKHGGLSIRDPNVSRQHAVIELCEGRYFLVDLGSTNGTFVNGERITRVPIGDGDVVRICDHEVRFSSERRA
jgi:FHA domain